MSDTLVILSQEFVNRIHVALGEIQAKFAIPVFQEIEAWVHKVENAPHQLLADVEAHLAPVKARVEADKAEAERIASIPKEIAHDIARDIAA